MVVVVEGRRAFCSFVLYLLDRCFFFSFFLLFRWVSIIGIGLGLLVSFLEEGVWWWWLWRLNSWMDFRRRDG